jgi:hypothetical protein
MVQIWSINRLSFSSPLAPFACVANLRGHAVADHCPADAGR